MKSNSRRERGAGSADISKTLPASHPVSRLPLPDYRLDSAIVTMETPQVQLDIILNLRVKNAAYPLEILDALYTRILLSIAKPDLAFLWLRAHHLITNINQVKGRSPSARFFNDLCESSAGEAQLIFGALPSLIHIPQAGYYSYSFYHKSFVDYLEDPHRCQAFSHISVDMVHGWILERFARTLLCASHVPPFHRL